MRYSKGGRKMSSIKAKKEKKSRGRTIYSFYNFAPLYDLLRDADSDRIYRCRNG